MSLNETGIGWTDCTCNFVHGCSKVSEGCRNCYAERVSLRFGHTEHPWTVEHVDENVDLKRHVLAALDGLPGPRWVFINSMSDLLHPVVPPSFVGDALGACAAHPHSAFQVLTKHGPEIDRDLMAMPRNVMLGVSVESPRRAYRLDWLREREAATKFVSFEPLIECIPDVDLSGIDWAIIGGETGPPDARRPMDPAWARNLVRACRRQYVAVFFKQHSGARPEADIELEIRPGYRCVIREFPELPEGIVPAPQAYLDEDGSVADAVGEPVEVAL